MRTLPVLASLKLRLVLGLVLRLGLGLGLGAACGQKPAPAIPALPGDGDSHVAKPPPPAAPAAPDAYTGRSDLIEGPSVRPPQPIELPKLEEMKLGNGLTVYAVKNPRLPLVSVQLAIRAGRMQEPRSRLGVSELTANMLVKGTRTHDAAGLARAIDFVGGTISADATFEATLVSCSALTRNTGACLDLVTEMVTQPTFPESELAGMREQVLAKIQQRMDDAATLASAHAQNLLWGNEHVRGWINSQQSMGSLHRDDLVAWHRTWFVPNNAMLVIVGDIDPKKLRADLERSFGTWRKATLPPAPTFREQGLSGSRVRLVDRPGATQTEIRIAQFGIKHDDPRFFDTLVWNHALGGAGNARLAHALRASGKPYPAGSSFDRNMDRGAFVVSSSTRNSDAVSTAKLLLAEIAKMAKDGPTQDEVGNAIVSITGGYGLRFQVASEFGAALISAELHGFGQEYLSNYPVAVSQVTVAEAKRAAGEILDPKAYIVVLVGDAKDLEPALTKEGWRYEKVAATDPVTAPYVPPELPVDPKTTATAHKLIEDALAAKGGKAKLSAIKAFRLVASGTTMIQGQSVPVELARVFAQPDRMRIDATIKPPRAQRSIVVSVGASGKAGWQRGPDPQTGEPSVTDLTGNAFGAVDFERWREPELILLKAADPEAKLALLADDTIDGKLCSGVVLRSPFGSIDLALYIDKKTKLLTRMTFVEGGNTETDDFADYRESGGVKWAYKRVSNGAGRSTSVEIKTVEVDPAIEPGLFDKPAK